MQQRDGMRLFGTIVSYLDAGRILASGRLDQADPVARIIGSVTSFPARLPRKSRLYYFTSLWTRLISNIMKGVFVAFS